MEKSVETVGKEKQWQAVKRELFKTYKLIFIQKFHGNGQCGLPLCDHCEINRAIGLWQDKDGKGHAMCFRCSIGEEPIINDVTYRPTEYPQAIA